MTAASQWLGFIIEMQLAAGAEKRMAYRGAAYRWRRKPAVSVKKSISAAAAALS
jgi:hypothetical protein